MKIPSALLFFGGSALFAHAGSWLDGDHLTGDWRGQRTAMEDSGVKVFGYYNAIYAANVSGGIGKDANYAGDLYAGVEFDLEKLLGWDSTVFTISGIDRHGSSIDAEVGGQYSVMQLVGGQNTFLYGVNIEKRFLDDTLSVKLGRLSATDDFVGSSLYSYSLNNAVNGQIRAVLFDGVMTSYPFPVWGGRIKYQPNDGFYAMLGVYQLTDDMFDREGQGVDFAIHRDDGVSIFTQLGWSPEIQGRPSNFYVGMNNAFDKLERFNTMDTTRHFVRFYGHADHQVYAESPGSEEGLTLFSTLGYTWQEDVAIIPVQTTFGMHYTGLIPCRPQDRTVFFMTYGKFSDDFAAEERAAGRGGPDYEMVLELGHRFQLTDFSYIQPDVQYIVRPGGTGEIDNALVLGVQMGVTF